MQRHCSSWLITSAGPCDGEHALAATARSERGLRASSMAPMLAGISVRQAACRQGDRHWRHESAAGRFQAAAAAEMPS